MKNITYKNFVVLKVYDLEKECHDYDLLLSIDLKPMGTCNTITYVCQSVLLSLTSKQFNLFLYCFTKIIIF